MFYKHSTRYSMEVPMADFRLLMMAEGISWYGPELSCERAEKIEGIFDFDFNGHFGNQIIFSVENDHDNADTMAAVKKLVEDVLEEIKEFQIGWVKPSEVGDDWDEYEILEVDLGAHERMIAYPKITEMTVAEMREYGDDQMRFKLVMENDED